MTSIVDRLPAATGRFFEHAPDVLCVVGFDGVVQRVNPAGERLLDWPEGEVDARSLLDVVHPDARAALEAALATLVADSPAVELELRCRGNDGGDRWLAWTAQVDVAAGLIYAIGRDITERKQHEIQQADQLAALTAAQGAAEAERARLFDLFMQAPAGIAVYRGPEHVIELANPRYRQMAGRNDASDIIGKPLREALPELAGQGFVELADRLYASGESFVAEEMPVQIDRLGTGEPDQVFVNLAVQPFRDGDGHVAGLLAHAVEVTAQVRAREGEAAARAQLATVLEHLPVGVIVVGANGRTLMANRRVAEILGYPPIATESLEQYGHYTAIHADGRRYTADEYTLVRAITRGEAIHDETVRFLRGDGGEGTLSVSAAPIRDEAGNVTAGVVVFEDASDRLAATAAMHETAERLRIALASADEGDWALDLETGELQISERCKTHFGLPPHATVSAADLDAMTHPDDRARIQEIIERARANHDDYTVEYRVRWPDGATHWVMASGRYLTVNGGRQLVGVMRDITERKRAEALREIERRVLEQTARDLPLPEVLATLASEIEALVGDFLVSILLLDADGQHLRHGAGPSLPESYVCAIDGVEIGPEVGSCGAAAYRRERVITTDIATEPRCAPFRELALGHGLRAAWSAPVFASDGRVVGTFCLYARRPAEPSTDDLALIDAAAGVAALAIERKQAEMERERLLQAAQAARAASEAALKARDEFLSIAAHELRNPVTALKGAAQMLRRSVLRGSLDTERAKRQLDVLTETSDRLAALVNDLLDVSRLQGGQLTVQTRSTDLAALVRRVVERQKALAPRAALRLDTLDAPYTIPADPARVEQILVNLLDNAAKYSPDGGEIVVSLGREGEAAVLRVRDRGIGLPPGAAERIFEPFGRAPNAAARQIPGMGLGLYICRQIAEAHGGRLWAESAGEDQGTTFTLVLPLGEPPGDA